LRAAGWKPAVDGSYLQPFEVVHFNPQKGTYKISLNGEMLKPEEYRFLPFSLDPAASPFTFDLVFAGHGIFAPEKGVDNFQDVDVSEKAVVSLYGAPWTPDAGAPHAFDRVVGKAVHATVRGADFLVYVTEELDSPPASSPDLPFLNEMVDAVYAMLPAGKAIEPAMGMGPVLAISRSAFDRTLARATGADYATWQKTLADNRQFKARPIEAKLEVVLNVNRETGPASNVVAKLEGTDPSLKDEWVLLTAHYDHLGFKQVGPGEDGIWNGADDNASGTAAVLEVARCLAADGPPRRSVLILLTAGEDRGILGSAHYAKTPIIPYDKVAININVDMVGRYQGAITGYTAESDSVFKVAAQVAKTRGMDLSVDPHPEWRMVYFIDSYHFARFDVPFVFFFTSFHEDYHQPSDEVEKIRFRELTQVTDLVAELTRYYAGGAPKPSFKRPAWFLTPE
ncbi:MAG TPA: M28 family peptidase, partial [Acidobacteriota bacterium]|nr:M28 family peptidase [Acidobacteriota bacterium]